jgi:tetratricopeptide (TPR) repeat protein
MVLGQPDQRLGPLLAAANRAERIGRAAEALGPILDALADGPDAPGLLGKAWSLLDLPGHAEAEVRRALALARAGRSAVALLLRARCHRLLGEPGPALADLNAAATTEVGGFIPRDEWFGVAVSAGAYRQAEEILAAGRPAGRLPSPRNSRAPGEERLSAALLAADRGPQSAKALAELAGALSLAGFHAPASNCAARALALRPSDQGLQELLAKALAWETFLEDARLIFARLLEKARQGGAGASLSEVRELLARASVRRLTVDVVSAVPEQSYPFVGSVLRTDAAGSPAMWAERGTLLVVGQRTGAPVAAVTMRLVARFDGLLDGDVEYDLALCRGASVSMGDAGLGAIAGFTLPGWIVIDLDVIDRTAARIRRESAAARRVDPWPATDGGKRRSLWFPGGVRERLSARIGDPDDAVLLATLAHERGHAVDAARFVPFLPNLPAALLAFAGHGFSPDNVEVGLERTAEIWALRHAPDTRAALENTLLFLPYEQSAPPHSRAYYGIVEDLVVEIDTNPSDYPSVDPRFNILQQLDRLSDEELSRAIDRALR